MGHVDVTEYETVYTSKNMGEALEMGVTHVNIPDPYQRYEVTMGDRHVAFMACDLFDALEKVMELVA